jgi:hypothetical protein
VLLPVSFVELPLNCWFVFGLAFIAGFWYCIPFRFVELSLSLTIVGLFSVHTLGTLLVLYPVFVC